MGAKWTKTITMSLFQKSAKKLAREILENEKELDKRTLLLDEDIAEITRKIGLETIQEIYESILEEHIALKKRRKVRNQT